VKILVLAPQPFYQERGTPIAVRLVLETLSAKLASRSGERPLIDLLAYDEGSDISIPGVRIVRTRTPSFLRGIRPGISLKKLLCDVFFTLSAFSLLWRARKEQYAVVHAVEEAVFIAWLAKKLFGTPYLYDMDSSLSMQLTEKWRIFRPLLPLLSFLEGVAVRGSSAVAPVCDALQLIAERHGSPHTVMLRDVSLLPEGDSPRVSVSQIFGSPVQDGRPVVLYVGNLERYQGIDLLLESFALIAQHPTNPQLVVIGGTDASIEAYARKASALGCRESVAFLGPRPVADLKSFLQHAEILVSPRIKGNNTPMKVYSYLHSGTALVATDLPTHSQVLDGEIAVLAAAGPNEFAAGIRTLLDSPELRAAIGSRARERAETLYTVPAFETQLLALYTRLGGQEREPGAEALLQSEAPQ
jgi:glycosyltransferase involved in cell wall biosynthesis